MNYMSVFRLIIVNYCIIVCVYSIFLLCLVSVSLKSRVSMFCSFHLLSGSSWSSVAFCLALSPIFLIFFSSNVCLYVMKGYIRSVIRLSTWKFPFWSQKSLSVVMSCLCQSLDGGQVVLLFLANRGESVIDE